MLASTPIDLGVDGYLLRETARRRDASHRLLIDVLSALKLTIAIPVFWISFVLVNLLGYAPDERAAVYVLSGGLLLDSLSRSLASVFNAYELRRPAVDHDRGPASRWPRSVLLALGAGYGVVTVAATYSDRLRWFGFVASGADAARVAWIRSATARCRRPRSWLRAAPA